jgi:predicted AlkP superfamily pyrophosphatase or phosphodiesterase
VGASVADCHACIALYLLIVGLVLFLLVFVDKSSTFLLKFSQDPDKVQEWTALYYALIEEIDDEIGILMSSLGEKASNTLVIFTSDHGEMLGAHGKREKNNFHEGRMWWLF